LDHSEIRFQGVSDCVDAAAHSPWKNRTVLFVWVLTLLLLPNLAQGAEVVEGAWQRIREAQQLLGQQPLRCTASERKAGGKSLRGCQEPPLVAVASAKGDGILVVPAENDLTVTRGLVLQRGTPNGVNTSYLAVYPPHSVALAVRQGLTVSGKGRTQVVYTPYSPALNVPEVRQKGLGYLYDVTRTAQKRLRARRVSSAAFSGERVGHALPEDLVVALALVEHMDPARFKSGDSVETLMGEVLTVVGANRETAFDYAVSPAGARGLWQFTRTTYDELRRRYPQAGLRRDFVRGSDDHVNAAMASLLLMDADLAALRGSLRNRLREESMALLGRFLAAAYNAGVGRAVHAYGADGGRFLDALPFEETRIYVRKFDATLLLLKETKS
jgi:hypothetical protein